MPIVTTATCAIPEFFEDGVNCLMFETNEECIEKVNELLADPELAKRLGAAAREMILDKCNVERYTLDWALILAQTLGNYHNG